MLVLSRKQNEKIIVGDNVTITILKIRGNTVRIGIEAPRDIHVMRGELVRDEPAESASITVEFKSNGSGPGDDCPSLRVVTQEVDVDAEDNYPGVCGVHRLQQLVSKVNDSERKAQ